MAIFKAPVCQGTAYVEWFQTCHMCCINPEKVNINLGYKINSHLHVGSNNNTQKGCPSKTSIDHAPTRVGRETNTIYNNIHNMAVTLILSEIPDFLDLPTLPPTPVKKL